MKTTHLLAAAAAAVAFAVGADRALGAPPALLPVTTPGGCVSTTGNGWIHTGFIHCTYNPLVKSAWAAAVSPDGKNVYVVSRGANSLVAFARDPSTGALTQLPEPGGCFTKHGSDGCAVGRALWQPVDVAVSPDGWNVYVASRLSGGVAVFERDKYGSGALTQAPGKHGCVTETGSGGACAQGRALAGARALTVMGLADADAPSYVYVASELASGVAAFIRNRYAGAGDGSLRQEYSKWGCVEHDGHEGCTPGRAILGPDGIASAGSNVYVASGGSGGVAVFSGGGNEGLVQLPGTSGCITANGSGGACAKARAVEAALGIFVSADKNTVYVTRGGGPEAASFGPPDAPEAGVAVFSRAANGSLSQLGGGAGCLTPYAKEGCGSWLRAPDFRAWAVALTPDSAYLPSFAATRRTTGATAGSLVDLSPEPWDAYWWTSAMVASPDGRNIYVLGSGGEVGLPDDGIQVYRRAGT